MLIDRSIDVLVLGGGGEDGLVGRIGKGRIEQAGEVDRRVDSRLIVFFAHEGGEGCCAGERRR